MSTRTAGTARALPQQAVLLVKAARIRTHRHRRSGLGHSQHLLHRWCQWRYGILCHRALVSNTPKHGASMYRLKMLEACSKVRLTSSLVLATMAEGPCTLCVCFLVMSFLWAGPVGRALQELHQMASCSSRPLQVLHGPLPSGTPAPAVAENPSKFVTSPSTHLSGEVRPRAVVVSDTACNSQPPGPLGMEVATAASTQIGAS